MNLSTPERIARAAFGSVDWLKLQAEHERFLREIKNLPKDKQAIEMLNAANYLINNKLGYWSEISWLLHTLLKEDEDSIAYCNLDDMQETFNKLEPINKELRQLLEKLATRIDYGT